MASDERINVRIPREDRMALATIAERFGVTLKRRMTESDVVRLAIADYIRRNG